MLRVAKLRGMTAQPWHARIPTWTLADRLRKARESAEMEQAELAAAIGVSRTTVSTAERGVSNPRRHVVMAWAMATGTDVTWLETGRDPRPMDGGPVAECAARDSNPEPADLRARPARELHHRLRVVDGRRIA